MDIVSGKETGETDPAPPTTAMMAVETTDPAPSNSTSIHDNLETTDPAPSATAMMAHDTREIDSADEEDEDFNPNNPTNHDEDTDEDSDGNVEEPSEESDAPMSDDEAEAAEQEEIRELLREREIDNQEFMNERFAEERDRVDAECAVVLGEGIFSPEQLAILKNPYIADTVVDKDGKESTVMVHKRTVTKRLNQSRSIRKTTDRPLRAMSMSKGGRDRTNTTPSIVGEAFDAAKHGQFDTGTNLYKTGDFCAVIVQTKAKGRSTKTFMLIGIFKQFGETCHKVPLNHAWPIDKESYAASICILQLEACNIGETQCIRASDIIISTLKKVDSSCILSINPSLQRTGTDTSNPTVQNVMTIEELKTAFDIVALRGKHHPIKDSDSNIQPVQINNTPYFVATGDKAASHNLPLLVCTLCNPPQKITGTNTKAGTTPRFADEKEQQRALRNHMALHQLATPNAMRGNEPCAFCCGSCHAMVKVTRKNKKEIEDKGAAVKPGTDVLPNCHAYPSLPPFKFFHLKIVSGYPSSNTLVYCKDCEDFVWSYNISKHNDVMHAGKRVPSAYVLPSVQEKNDLMESFSIAV